jgi:hypothetical protein
VSGAGEGPRELLIRSGTAESQHVMVAVRDSGPGLDPKSLNCLFEAFYTTKPQGMGMELTICRSIVDARGGRLWATANDDRGATFQFTCRPAARSCHDGAEALYSSPIMMMMAVTEEPQFHFRLRTVPNFYAGSIKQSNRKA